MKKKFYWKGFVSFSLGWVFIIIFLSGIVLYIAPPGRIANWTDWVLMGFSKSTWQSIHTIFSYTFVILSVFHLFFLNWKAFWSYVAHKTSNGINKKKELLISLLLVSVIFLGTFFNIQPFKAVIDFGEWAKESWETTEEQPPVPHAELLTIREWSEKYIQLPADTVLLMIQQKGFKADSTGQTLAEISNLNNITPAHLFSVFTPQMKVDTLKRESKTPLQGMGRKTISQIAGELGKDVDDIIVILRKNGIEAKPGDKLKDVAENAGIAPMDLFELIK